MLSQVHLLRASVNPESKRTHRWVHLVRDLELLARGQHNGRDGRVVRVAHAWEEVVHHLRNASTAVAVSPARHAAACSEAPHKGPSSRPAEQRNGDMNNVM